MAFSVFLRCLLLSSSPSFNSFLPVVYPVALKIYFVCLCFSLRSLFLKFFSFTSPRPCFFKMFYVYFYPVRGLQLWIICCPSLVLHYLNFDFYVSLLVHCPYFLTFSSLHPLAFKILFLCLLVSTLVSLFSIFFLSVLYLMAFYIFFPGPLLWPTLIF